MDKIFYRVRYFADGELMLVLRKPTWDEAEEEVKALGFRPGEDKSLWQRNDHLTAEIVSSIGLPVL